MRDGWALSPSMRMARGLVSVGIGELYPLAYGAWYVLPYFAGGISLGGHQQRTLYIERNT